MLARKRVISLVIPGITLPIVFWLSQNVGMSLIHLLSTVVCLGFIWIPQHLVEQNRVVRTPTGSLELMGWILLFLVPAFMIWIVLDHR